MDKKIFQSFLEEINTRQRAANNDKAIDFYKEHIQPLVDEHSHEDLQNPKTEAGRKFYDFTLEYEMIKLDYKWDKEKSRRKEKTKERAKSKGEGKGLDMD